MLAYRKSRVLPALPALMAGPGGLERAVVRDALTAAALERIFALGADVLAIEFEALTGEPAGRCSTRWRGCAGPRPFGRIDKAPVNPAERARFAPLAAATKLAAWALRAAGARRTLQALKDDPRLVRLVFRPACADELPRAQRGGVGAARPARGGMPRGRRGGGRTAGGRALAGPRRAPPARHAGAARGSRNDAARAGAASCRTGEAEVRRGSRMEGLRLPVREAGVPRVSGPADDPVRRSRLERRRANRVTPRLTACARAGPSARPDTPLSRSACPASGTLHS